MNIYTFEIKKYCFTIIIFLLFTNCNNNSKSYLEQPFKETDPNNKAKLTKISNYFCGQTRNINFNFFEKKNLKLQTFFDKINPGIYRNPDLIAKLYPILLKHFLLPSLQVYKNGKKCKFSLMDFNLYCSGIAGGCIFYSSFIPSILIVLMNLKYDLYLQNCLQLYPIKSLCYNSTNNYNMSNMNNTYNILNDCEFAILNYESTLNVEPNHLYLSLIYISLIITIFIILYLALISFFSNKLYKSSFLAKINTSLLKYLGYTFKLEIPKNKKKQSLNLKDK